MVASPLCQRVLVTEQENEYFGLRDLSHAPDLAAALGNMIVAWAYAEHTLLQVISRVTGAGLNMSLAGYFRIPTFEARTKLILALLSEWSASHYDKEVIITRVRNLGNWPARCRT